MSGPRLNGEDAYYVYVEDGATLINVELVKRGIMFIARDIQLAGGEKSLLLSAQRDAQRARRGLWASCNP